MYILLGVFLHGKGKNNIIFWNIIKNLNFSVNLKNTSPMVLFIITNSLSTIKVLGKSEFFNTNVKSDVVISFNQLIKEM